CSSDLDRLAVHAGQAAAPFHRAGACIGGDTRRIRGVVACAARKQACEQQRERWGVDAWHAPIVPQRDPACRHLGLRRDPAAFHGMTPRRSTMALHPRQAPSRTWYRLALAALLAALLPAYWLLL